MFRNAGIDERAQFCTTIVARTVTLEAAKLDDPWQVCFMLVPRLPTRMTTMRLQIHELPLTCLKWVTQDTLWVNTRLYPEMRYPGSGQGRRS